VSLQVFDFEICLSKTETILSALAVLENQSEWKRKGAWLC